MKLKKSLEEKVMDVRLRDRLVGEGKITKKEVDSYLGGLSEEPASAYESVSTEAATVETTEE